MSVTERIRLDALSRVKRKEMTVVAAAELMDVSLRQARRLWKRFRAGGDAGLVHGLRGRSGNRRLDEETRERVVKRHQERYADFGPTLACEKLAEEGLAISPNTLTALLKERGLWERRRRRGRHRARRERRAGFGSLLQIDGSHHDWFEGRGPKCVLMVVIDDATNRTLARFHAAETTEAAFDVFGRWAAAHGIARGVYVDKHSIYRDADDPARLTQFGRAMKELGVELTCAHSPQAKGRVERRHAVFQDRLVREMRLRGINDMARANDLLEHSFLAELDRRFAVAPASSADLHRPAPPGVSLGEVLCVREERTVGNDWCVRWSNRWLQIGPEHGHLRLPRRRVTVRELSDGRLLLEHDGQRLGFTELAARPAPPRPATKPVVNNRRYKPAADHPWNRKTPAAATTAAPAGPPRPPARPAPAAPARAERRKAG